MSDDVEAAFMAGWAARDARVVPAQQLLAPHNQGYAATADVPGMMEEDFEDWVDSLEPEDDHIVRQLKPVRGEDEAARALRQHPSNSQDGG